jgi:hypothetical protein
MPRDGGQGWRRRRRDATRQTLVDLLTKLWKPGEGLQALVSAEPSEKSEKNKVRRRRTLEELDIKEDSLMPSTRALLGSIYDVRSFSYYLILGLTD